jgi:hypothetical protein
VCLAPPTAPVPGAYEVSSLCLGSGAL